MRRIFCVSHLEYVHTIAYYAKVFQVSVFAQSFTTHQSAVELALYIYLSVGSVVFLKT